jgi:hypothetical protein
MSNPAYAFKPATEAEKEAIENIKSLLQANISAVTDEIAHSTEGSVTDAGNVAETTEIVKKVFITPAEYEKLSDITILRFYRGRKSDIDKTYDSIIMYLGWRKQHNVDNINADIVKMELDSGKVILAGKDHYGRPCVNVLVRKHRKDQRDLETMRNFIIYLMEEIVKSMIPDDQKMVIVFDMHDFGLACMDFEVVKILIDVLQFNYPETLSCALVLNSPFIFSACWAVIRPWLDPDTRAKVMFTGSADIGQFVVKSSLPSELKL